MGANPSCLSRYLREPKYLGYQLPAYLQQYVNCLSITNIMIMKKRRPTQVLCQHLSIPSQTNEAKSNQRKPNWAKSIRPNHVQKIFFKGKQCVYVCLAVFLQMVIGRQYSISNILEVLVQPHHQQCMKANSKPNLDSGSKNDNIIRFQISPITLPFFLYRIILRQTTSWVKC